MPSACGLPLHLPFDHPFHRCHCHGRGCTLPNDAEFLPRLKLDGISPPLPVHMLDEAKQEQFLAPSKPKKGYKPIIVDFAPHFAYPNSLIVILGHNFHPRRDKNEVKIGGRPAIIVTAEPHRLVVVSNFFAEVGPVEVRTRKGVGKSQQDFNPIPGPPPGLPFQDAPPLSFEGIGSGTTDSVGVLPVQGETAVTTLGTEAAGLVRTLDQLPNTGTSRVLCVCLYPWDVVPADLTAARQTIQNLTDQVALYYTQASYGDLTVNFTVTDYYEMTDDRDYYHDTSISNFKNGATLQQVWTEAAHQASTHGHDLNNFDVLMVACHVQRFARAWGNIIIPTGSRDLFRPADPPRRPSDVRYTVNIPKRLFAMIVSNTANWGRVAHEYGHNLIDNASVLPEDIYASDLPAGSDFTGQNFDLMGSHDSHPLFSAYFMNQLRWYESPTANVHNVQTSAWSRTPFRREFDLVAHGPTRNANASKAHLVKIEIGAGLEYWIEVRQKPGPVSPGTTAQIFDPSIPTQGTADGGVLVSRVIRSVQNNNQQMRLITLLQSRGELLVAGEIATDAARNIKISVVDDNVQARPRVCRVRVEWEQPVVEDPAGRVDLWIEPWDTRTYTTPDIWVVPPGGSSGTNDPPVVGQNNTIRARIHNGGVSNAAGVEATIYAIEPPGVGDNGSWTPLGVRTISSLAAGGQAEVSTSWVPRLDKHTCLQVVIGRQAGEITFGNNRAQENIFRFQPASSSVPHAVELPVAVRNPLNVATQAVIHLLDVPEGFYVYFPHRVVSLAPRGERNLELLIIPLRKIPDLPNKIAKVRVTGHVPREYREPYPSLYQDMGGIQAVVEPKQGCRIRLIEPARETEGAVTVSGEVIPATAKQRVRVDLKVQGEMWRLQTISTDEAGKFTARFVLRDRGDVSPAEGERVVNPLAVPTTKADLVVELAFQAHISNSTVLAPTDSNIVYYKYTVKVPNNPDVPRID